MRKNAYRNKSYYIILTITFFLISLLFFCWNQDLFNFSSSISSDKFGQFGDFFGGVLGTIFALISVLFLINTFIQQQKITSKNEILVNSQRFNDLFFELLNLYQSQTKELQDEGEFEKEEGEKKIKYKYSCDNKDFFDFNKKKMQESFVPQNSYSKNNREARNSYSLFYLEHKSKLAIYYRTLYRIFDLIENSNLLDEPSKRHYSKIIRAQLTESELFFLRYNALTYYGENFIFFLNRYNVLKHLPHFELLEFKSWWNILNSEERNSIDALFFIIKDIIKDIESSDGNVKKQVPIASVKYKINISLINRIDLLFEVIINNNKSNTTSDYIGFDKFTKEQIQALLDCFIKELVIYSNFKNYNKMSDLKFYSSPILLKSNVITIQSGVKNKLDKALKFKYIDNK